MKNSSKLQTTILKLAAVCLSLAGSLQVYADINPTIKNAPFEVVIPTGLDIIYKDISPGGGDPSIVFRITTMASNSWFDAIAPYSNTAVGVYSQLPRRPEAERTDKNRNTAIMYASYRVFSSLLPNRIDVWKKMLTDVGLDPNNNSMDLSSPIGIGNTAGNAIVAARLHDGHNQLGDEKGCKYNCKPYADYTNYQPVNTAYQFNNPSRWQPSIGTSGNGLFNIQTFVTPFLGRVTPYTISSPKDFIAPFPKASQAKNYREYKEQVDAILDASAGLTDEQKMKAELFDNKFNSSFAAAASVATLLNLSLEESVAIEFATNVASFDTIIAIWYNKRKYDAPRPFSAIGYIYGNQKVTAWGGPGKGTVYDMPASQWKSYLPVNNHPEYPSGTSGICGAHAEVMRRLYGEKNLKFSVSFPAGTSKIEPGITPAKEVVISWDNWTDYEKDCVRSRLLGGVHFPEANAVGRQMGNKIGAIAYKFVKDHLEGKHVTPEHTNSNESLEFESVE